MLTPEERSLVTNRQDHLIELCVEQQEATRAADWGRVSELQVEIDDAKGELELIRASAE